MTNGTKNQRGLTILELMLALFISGVMSIGMIQLFGSSKQTYRVQDGLARLQENARFAAEFIAKDMRMAGYRGCISALDQNDRFYYRFNNNLNDSDLYAMAVGIQGFEADAGSWTPALYADILTGIGGAPADVSDVLTMRIFEPVPDTAIQTAVADPLDPVEISAGTSLVVGDIVSLADCKATSITQITSLSGGTQLAHVSNSGTPGNTTADLGYRFGLDAGVYRGVVKSYYVAPGASGEPSLWELRSTPSGSQARELVDGIEDLQVLYGVDTIFVDNGLGSNDDDFDIVIDEDGQAGENDLDSNETDNRDDSRHVTRYLSAADIEAEPDPVNWSNVVSVQLNLLARSADNLATEPQPYTFNGVTVTPTDRRLRRVFSTTIGVRNRLH